MREIKFRAWWDNGKDEGEMLFVGDKYGTKHPLDCCAYAIQRQPVTLMQFTGLFDKNGKEIYEGDILSITNPLRQIQKARLIGVVEFLWAAFSVEIKRIIEWKSYNVDPPPFMSLSSIAGSKEMAVIGNIYQDSHLLDKHESY